MRNYLIYGIATLALLLGLQTVLPHRLEEGRSTEVLGKLNHYLKWRPRGVAVAQLGDAFEWDRVCAVKAGASPEAFQAEANIEFPKELELGRAGAAWLLVFAKGQQAMAVTEVPIASMGDIEQEHPFTCIEDHGAFFTVIEEEGTSTPPRRFILRS